MQIIIKAHKMKVSQAKQIQHRDYRLNLLHTRLVKILREIGSGHIQYKSIF